MPVWPNFAKLCRSATLADREPQQARLPAGGQGVKLGAWPSPSPSRCNDRAEATMGAVSAKLGCAARCSAVVVG